MAGVGHFWPSQTIALTPLGSAPTTDGDEPVSKRVKPSLRGASTAPCRLVTRCMPVVGGGSTVRAVGVVVAPVPDRTDWAAWPVAAPPARVRASSAGTEQGGYETGHRVRLQT